MLSANKRNRIFANVSFFGCGSIFFYLFTIRDPLTLESQETLVGPGSMKTSDQL